MTVQTFTILNKANHTGAITTQTATIPALDPSTHLPVSITNVRLYIDSTNNQGVIQYSDPNTHIDAKDQLSFDAGKTWQDDAEFTSDGGYLNPRTGLAQDPEMTVDYTPALSAGVQVRGTVTVTGTVRFALLVDVTTA